MWPATIEGFYNFTALQSVNIAGSKKYYCYVLDSGFQAAGEAVLVSQAAQQAQLQVRPVFIEKCVS
jgi:hypothetical protein